MTDELDSQSRTKSVAFYFCLFGRERTRPEEEEGPELRTSGLKPLISRAPLTHFVSKVRCGCCGTKKGEKPARKIPRKNKNCTTC